MKKVIFLLTAVLLTASCCGCFERVEDPENFQVISMTSYKVKDENRNETLYPDVIKYQFEGHYYILTSFSNYCNGVIHDPNCPVCQQKNVEDLQFVYETVLEGVMEQLKANREAEKKDIQELKKIVIRNTTSILNKINENDIEYD